MLFKYKYGGIPSFFQPLFFFFQPLFFQPFIQFDGTPYFSEVSTSVFTGAAANTNANIEERENRKFWLLFSQT